MFVCLTLSHSLHWISPCLVVLLQQFQLEPLTSTVLQGSDVQFRATVDGTWRVMTWNVRGLLVLTVLVDSNITSSPGQFSATFCSSGSTSCVDFIIHNVTRRESGPVICTVQGEYGSKTAQLNVQGKVMNSIQLYYCICIDNVFVFSHTLFGQYKVSYIRRPAFTLTFKITLNISKFILLKSLSVIVKREV